MREVGHGDFALLASRQVLEGQHAPRGLVGPDHGGPGGAAALRVPEQVAGFLRPVRELHAGRVAGVAGGTLVTLEELTGEALASQVAGFTGGGARGRVA